MKLKCVRDVVMNSDGRVAFKAGEEYDFKMNADGTISKTTEFGFHYFLTYGPSQWTNYFVKELEQ